jgi:hypothetical protein
MHFGLGAAENAEIRIIWPDGKKTDWINVGSNQAFTITRGKGALHVVSGG